MQPQSHARSASRHSPPRFPRKHGAHTALTPPPAPAHRAWRGLAGFACPALALLLGACAALPPVQQPPSALSAAQSAARSGNHVLAAERYEQLAAQSAAPEGADLRLAAAREWLAADRPLDARRVLALLVGPLTPPQRFERDLLDARALLASGQPERAWAEISSRPTPMAAAQATPWLELKTRIAFAARRPVDGIHAEMAAERFASGPAQRRQLRTQLLAALKAAGTQGVALDTSMSRNRVVQGWLALGALAAEAPATTLARESAEQRWRERFPDHPATELLGRLLPSLGAPGTRVALLLPLTGPNAAQAMTVRDGFLSAFYELPAANRPAVQIVDTGTMSVAQAFAQARAAGSNFIVGPLIRGNVEAAAALGNEPLPVLALNFLPGEIAGPANFYQFALSPVSEARLVAQRVLADGHRRGVALVPAGDWGQRVLAAFTTAFEAGGGRLLGQAVYDPDAHDYSAEITSVLRIDQSEARAHRLERLLGVRLHYQPRRRADVGFVFAPGTPVDVRLLAAQLKFYYAGDIPTYTLPDAYEPGVADTSDLNGLMYPDMPWMIDGSPGLEPLREQLAQAWGTRAAWHTRLFAFGYDACQLVLAMQSGSGNPASVQVDGLTGELRFDADRRIARGLTWVSVRDGQPQPMGAADN